MEKTIECSLQEVDRELRLMIEDLLEPDEEVQVCFLVEFNMIWVEVITNRQVVAAKAIALRTNVFSFKPKIEMPVISSMLIRDIDHFDLRKNEDYDLNSVLIYSTDNRFLETNFTLESAARKFHQILSSVVKPGKPNRPSLPASERLKELIDLLDKNLITDEEYNQKRAEILKNL